MRILLVHNLYRAAIPSGENTVYAAERELLASTGHKVFEFTRSNDEISEMRLSTALQATLLMPWNPLSADAFQQVLRTVDPDVIHVHNTFPLITPAIFWAAKASRAAVVMTLHNYRLFCAAGIAMRDKHPCTLCLEKRSVLPALRYGCYRNSRLATLPVAAQIALHHRLGTWQRQVDGFIALTNFQRGQLIAAGLPTDRIYVKPNFTYPPTQRVPWQQRENKVVFVGRLASEKGCDLLLRAWIEWGKKAPQLELIGDGELATELKSLVTQHGLEDKVHMTGTITPQEVRTRMATARLLVLPSRCLESLSMSILEAYALGVPVVASRLGTLQSIVTEGETGHLFDCGNSVDLLKVLQDIWNQPATLERMSLSAVSHYEQDYSPAGNYAKLMDIYRQATLNRSHRPYVRKTNA
ncbi:MAG: glycosyltransferase family 4 protein [Nevskiales bacterium]